MALNISQTRHCSIVLSTNLLNLIWLRFQRLFLDTVHYSHQDKTNQFTSDSIIRLSTEECTSSTFQDHPVKHGHALYFSLLMQFTYGFRRLQFTLVRFLVPPVKSEAVTNRDRSINEQSYISHPLQEAMKVIICLVEIPLLN